MLTHAAPLREKRVDEIGTDDVLAVLKPIWVEKNETASRLRGRIERILDAAAAKGHRDPDKRNPAAWKGHLEHFLPRKRKTDKGHHGAVPWADMPAFWATISARRSSASLRALQLTILTAARTGETIGAKLAEFDLATKVWTVPATRMKMAAEHQVALSAPALAIVEEMAVGRAPGDFLFGRAGDKPLSNMAMLRFMQDELGREETVHGFRSSFRDWAGDATDFPRELAEMALSHTVGDDVELAYRRGRALEKRRPVMEAWARYLSGTEPSQP